MQRPRSRKNTRLFRTLLSCVLLIVCCMGVFLCPQTAKASSYPLYETEQVLTNEKLRGMTLQFRTPNDTIAYFTYDTTERAFSLTDQDVYDAVGFTNGDLSYGTEFSSNQNRWSLYYPFSGDYVFPSVVGHVDHYEITYTYQVYGSSSAECYSLAGHDSSNIWQYQPFSSMSYVVLYYVNTSGEIVYANTEDSDWFSVQSYTCYDVTEEISVSPSDTAYWNQVRTGKRYECKLTLRIDSFPSDFAYLDSSYLFFGRSSYFYYRSADSLYLKVSPGSTYLRTVWMTAADWQAKQAEDQYRDGVSSALGDVNSNLENLQDSLTTPSSDFASDVSDFNSAVDSAVSDILDQEQSWEDSIEAIYESYGVDPDSMEYKFKDVVADLRLEATTGWLSDLWSFFKDYKFLYLFLNTGLVFCMIVFLLRR